MSKTKRSAILGLLTYNDLFRHYETSIDHESESIQLTLVADSDDALEKLLPFAERVWEGRSVHIEAFREYAVSKLLDELNDFLVADDQGSELISAQELQRLLSVPTSMRFYLDHRNGDATEFSLTGGEADCLREHCLTVYFAADGRIKGGEVVRLF